MLYERLVANRVGDGLDELRRGAVERVRWLVDLLDRQCRLAAESPGFDLERYDEISAARERVRAEIHEGLRSCSAEERRAAAVVLMLVAELPDSLWTYRDELALVVPGTRGWTVEEVAVLLAASGERQFAFWAEEALGFAVTAAETLDVEDRVIVAPMLRDACVDLAGDDDAGVGLRSALVRRLRRLLGRVDAAGTAADTVPAPDPWAAPLRAWLGASPTPETAGLVLHLAALSGPRPSLGWRRSCVELVEAAGAAELAVGWLHVLATADALCSDSARPLSSWPENFHHHYLVHSSDRDLARGVVWAAALVGGAAAVSGLTALALRTGAPGGDVVEDLTVAGAAINALGAVEDASALEALWLLQQKVRHRGLRKQLDVALKAAAERAGITPAQVVERSVPGHGLGGDGTLAVQVGGYRAVVAVEDAASVRLVFVRPDGRVVRGVPAEVRESHAERVGELRALVKEVRGTLSAERARVEGLMAVVRCWAFEEWTRWYRDHPVTGAVTRGLVWEFTRPDGEWVAAVPTGDGLVGVDGRELTLSGPDTRVRLWHPIRAAVDEVRAWRGFVTERRLRQPFKQVFREVYLLTPAEQETGTYSNRFAAHVVHYRRLYALFKERGWQANFLGSYDGGYDGRARGTFAEWRWRACFYHEPAQEEFDYCPDYASTDQVRFERSDGRGWRQVPLAEVPPVVFSEAMRDVDLFVAVTSIAADPDWIDRGADRYADYWHHSAFGELAASAQVRRDALARILPGTRIADRCGIDGRYLTVRGELATYRIHLGSANVMTEPAGAYLCIVPARRQGQQVFLPFEDERLSLILSKAFLLAHDTAITDETILRQIHRSA